MSNHNRVKNDFVQAMASWINQRPGLEFANYGDVRAYRQKQRDIARDKKHAEVMLAAVRRREFSKEDIEAAVGAYSGRLSIDWKDGRIIGFDYCTGQYWPTEYRKVACAVLSSLLWNYWRANMPASVGKITRATGKGPFRSEYETDAYMLNGKKVSAGDFLRSTARAEFGRTIANKWFN